MRPSWSSFSSVSRAISRRTPSNPESTTAPGRVVDDEVDAGEVLQGADVAALAADDPALHVVGGELDHRHGRLGRVAGGEPLHARPTGCCARGARPRAWCPPRSGGCGARTPAWPGPRSPAAAPAWPARRHAGELLQAPLGLGALPGERLALELQLGLGVGDRPLPALEQLTALGERGLQRARGGGGRHRSGGVAGEGADDVAGSTRHACVRSRPRRARCPAR